MAYVGLSMLYQFVNELRLRTVLFYRRGKPSFLRGLTFPRLFWRSWKIRMSWSKNCRGKRKVHTKNLSSKRVSQLGCCVPVCCRSQYSITLFFGFWGLVILRKQCKMKKKVIVLYLLYVYLTPMTQAYCVASYSTAEITVSTPSTVRFKRCSKWPTVTVINRSHQVRKDPANENSVRETGVSVRALTNLWIIAFSSLLWRIYSPQLSIRRQFFLIPVHT
jgi:peroxiredoxin family protein